MLDIRIEGYDEYVKDFVKFRNNERLIPYTEEGIREWAKLLDGIQKIGCLWEEQSKDGQEHQFAFEFKKEETHSVLIRYVGME